MHTITIGKLVNIDNDRLIISGVVDGVAVKAEGSTGRVTNAKSEAHKVRYIESLLLSAAPLGASDAKVKGRFFRNCWIWIQCNWKVITVTTAIEELLRHYWK
jgi:hypothetical protein